MVGKGKQSGMTLMSMVIVLSVLGFFAYLVMRLFPVYNEYRAVVSVMNQMSAQAGLANSDARAIKESLYKRFNIAYVESVKPEHVKIERKGSSLVTLTISYEVRRPLMYNLDFVAKFDNSVQLQN